MQRKLRPLLKVKLLPSTLTDFSINKGQALLLVFLLSSIVGILAGALGIMWRSEFRIRSFEEDSLAAFYLAETGVERAKVRLANNWDDLSDISGNLGREDFQVNIQNTTTDPNRPRRQISSRGSVGDRRRLIVVEVERVQTASGPPPVFNFSQVSWQEQ